MKVSIITPTKARKNYLELLYQGLCLQSHADWEWLILDTSEVPARFADPGFCDSRVVYQHLDHEITIGHKRNLLTAKSQGEIIVHCDDDDYYVPSYLETIAQKLENADFFSLSSWFCYETCLKEFYYWDTAKIDAIHFMLSPQYYGEAREINLDALWDEAQKNDFALHAKQGYGFSYSYRKKVLQNCSFEDRNFSEDFAFFEAVKKRGYRMKLEPDEEGLVVHRLHGGNTAKVFPQFKIPSFIAEHYFPDFPHAEA